MDKTYFKKKLKSLNKLSIRNKNHIPVKLYNYAMPLHSLSATTALITPSVVPTLCKEHIIEIKNDKPIDHSLKYDL